MPRRLVLLFAAFLLLAASLCADVVVLKDGRRIEGRVIEDNAQKVRIETPLGVLEFARSEVASVEKGKTRREEYEERKRKAKTAADFYELALWAEDQRMRRETRESMQRTVELDPQHAGAHTWLGNVEYRGEWMSPEERDRRMQADRERELRERGLVRHGDQWVTPEERDKLERGLVLVDGRWLPFEEAQRAKGLEEFEGRWLPRAEAFARASCAQAAAASKRPFNLIVNAEALLAGPVTAEMLAQTAPGLVVGRGWFDAEFGTPPGLALLGGQLAQFYLFGTDDAPYLDTITTFAGWTPTLPDGWSAAVRRVHGFLYWDPFPLSSARQWHRQPDDLIGHCYHHWGHLLLNCLGYDGRLLPPWYDESFAALMEHQIHGRNAVFCRASTQAGRGTSARGVGFSFDPAILREGQWRKILSEALEARRVPQFDDLAKKEFSELELIDVAIGMGVLEWLLQLPDPSEGRSAVAAFHAVLRADAPALPQRVIAATADRRAVYERAFRAAAGLDLRAADAAWRSWFLSR
jgi:hypothetical protein